MTETLELPAEYREDDMIFFEDGLIGFENFKRYVMIESEAFSPFYLLQCVDKKEVSVLVLDPGLVVKNYNQSVPDADWSSIGVAEDSPKLSFVVSILRSTEENCSANFRAPILINFNEMTGRQVTLNKTRFSVTQPLVSHMQKSTERTMVAGQSN